MTQYGSNPLIYQGVKFSKKIISLITESALFMSAFCRILKQLFIFDILFWSEILYGGNL